MPVTGSKKSKRAVPRPPIHSLTICPSVRMGTSPPCTRAGPHRACPSKLTSGHTSERLELCVVSAAAHFLALNLNIGGCFDSYADGSSRDSDDGDDDLIADNETLALLPGQN